MHLLSALLLSWLPSLFDKKLHLTSVLSRPQAMHRICFCYFLHWDGDCHMLWWRNDEFCIFTKSANPKSWFFCCNGHVCQRLILPLLWICLGTRVLFVTSLWSIPAVLNHSHRLSLSRRIASPAEWLHSTILTFRKLLRCKRFVHRKQKLYHSTIYLGHILKNLPRQAGNFRPAVLTQQLTNKWKTRKIFRPSTN